MALTMKRGQGNLLGYLTENFGSMHLDKLCDKTYPHTLNLSFDLCTLDNFIGTSPMVD